MSKFSKEQVERIIKELGADVSVDALIKGMTVELEHKDLTGGDPKETAQIAIAHLKEDPAYYDKLSKMEKKNAKQFPKCFYAKHMETGLAGYENETILIDTDNLKSMIPTFVGKPVYVRHQEVDLDTMKDKACGYVTDSFYNELDGWLWVKMLVTDDDGFLAIANGWSVSNAYVPTEWGAGGTHHNCPYDRKIIGGEFTHLAIVPDPRYEEAKIYTPEEYKIYQEDKKKKLEEVHNSKEKDIKMSDETIEVKKGFFQEMFGELLNAVKKNADEDKKEEDKKEEGDTKKNADEEKMKVGDEEMTLKELINKYVSLTNKKNECGKGKEEEDKKENSEDKGEDDKKEDKDDKKENSKGDVDHFEELKNAHEKATFTAPSKTFETMQTQLQRGRDRY